MKFPTILPLFALLITPSLANSSKYEAICRQKSLRNASGAYLAIQGFCASAPFDPLPKYASKGLYYPGRPLRSATAKITTKNCSPGQGMLDHQTCLDHFWDVCANGGKAGCGKGRFSSGGCMTFQVQK